MQVLIADFFFVLAALGWLVAGAVAKTFFSNSVRSALHYAAAVPISCKITIPGNLMHRTVLRCAGVPQCNRSFRLH